MFSVPPRTIFCIGAVVAVVRLSDFDVDVESTKLKNLNMEFPGEGVVRIDLTQELLPIERKYSLTKLTITVVSNEFASFRTD